MTEKKPKLSKIQDLPISKLFPNMVTITSICFGITSIRYALNDQWDIAVTFIIISGLLDVLDGRLARYLDATSEFGAQLDSLADFVNFGIAPAIILYLWELTHINIKGLGWGLTLLYIICTAIRLARFNSDLSAPNKPEWKDRFFTGIPSPAAAYLVLMPIMISFNVDIQAYIHPLVIGLFVALIGVSMTSRIPTFSTKKIVIKKEHASFVMVLAALLITSIILAPWIILPLLGITYLASIAFSILHFKKLDKTQ